MYYKTRRGLLQISALYREERNKGAVSLLFSCIAGENARYYKNWADDHVNLLEIYGIGKEDNLSSEYYIEEWDLQKDIVLIFRKFIWI